MLRKSFRRGLGLGLLLGAAIAVYKTMEARRQVTAPEPQPWTPVSAPPPERVAAEPEPRARFEAPAPKPQPEPQPEPEPERRQPVDEVGEPVPEVPAEPAFGDDITPAKAQNPRRAARAAKKTTKKAPAAKKAAPTNEPWVDPDGRICPPSHPVKGKLASKIFHVPGGFNYERTVPDRCYRDAATAEGDGLRQSKR